MMKLKPCPFCGRPVDRFEARMSDGRISYLEVTCDCGKFEFYSHSGKGADEIWNSRAFAINDWSE